MAECKQIEITVGVNVTIPEGATHYGGLIQDEPEYFKCMQIAGYDHWFYYSNSRKDWFLASHSKPHWIKEIAQIIVEVK